MTKKIAEMEYTPKEVKKGYTDKSLHIDLSKMSIAEKDIPQKHADFLQLFPNKIIKMDIPIHLVGRGQAPGVQQGGKFVHKLRKLSVKALPDNMPEHIDVDVSKLGLGKSVKVSAITPDNFEILNSSIITVATVEVPRALKGVEGEEGEGEEVESAEGAEGAEETAEAES